MSQPLRAAYISIVTAVQDARLAASSSWGLGPVSLPPLSTGSSTPTSWPRILTTWRKPPSRLAVGFMLRLSTGWGTEKVFRLCQWIEEQPGRHLGEEVRGFRGHVDPGGGDLANLLDGS